MKKFIELFEEIYSKGGRSVEKSEGEKKSEEKRKSAGIRISPRRTSVASYIKKARKERKKKIGLSVHRKKTKLK